MIEKGFKTTKSLAAESVINRVTLGKILNGKIQPSTDAMFKLAETLDISGSEAGEIFFTNNLRIE